MRLRRLNRPRRPPRVPAPPTQPAVQPESVGTDSVDELSAVYGDKSAEDRDAAPRKQAPES